MVLAAIQRFWVVGRSSSIRLFVYSSIRLLVQSFSLSLLCRYNITPFRDFAIYYDLALHIYFYRILGLYGY